MTHVLTAAICLNPTRHYIPAVEVSGLSTCQGLLCSCKTDICALSCSCDLSFALQCLLMLPEVGCCLYFFRTEYQNSFDLATGIGCPFEVQSWNIKISLFSFIMSFFFPFLLREKVSLVLRRGMYKQGWQPASHLYGWGSDPLSLCPNCSILANSWLQAVVEGLGESRTWPGLQKYHWTRKLSASCVHLWRCFPVFWMCCPQHFQWRCPYCVIMNYYIMILCRLLFWEMEELPFFCVGFSASRMCVSLPRRVGKAVQPALSGTQMVMGLRDCWMGRSNALELEGWLSWVWERCVGFLISPQYCANLL